MKTFQVRIDLDTQVLLANKEEEEFMRADVIAFLEGVGLLKPADVSVTEVR